MPNTLWKITAYATNASFHSPSDGIKLSCFSFKFHIHLQSNQSLFVIQSRTLCIHLSLRLHNQTFIYYLFIYLFIKYHDQKNTALMHWFTKNRSKDKIEKKRIVCKIPIEKRIFLIIYISCVKSTFFRSFSEQFAFSFWKKKFHAFIVTKMYF